MKAVITVIGRDQVGIIAKVSAKCAEYGANITEITQSVLDKYFAMIMVAEIDGLTGDFSGICGRTRRPRARRRTRDPLHA